MTPSQARNAIKKCLKALVDPKPTKDEKDCIWAYFGNGCAYCGSSLTKKSREGHIDHLYSEMKRGSNRLSNLVLACETCNGDEKRESSWENFLVEKCGAGTDIFEERADKIRRWILQNGNQPLISETQEEMLASEFACINQVLTEKIERLREMYKPSSGCNR